LGEVRLKAWGIRWERGLGKVGAREESKGIVEKGTREKKQREGKTYIAALRAEKVANMPLRPARHHDLPLYRRLTALAPRRKKLVEVEMAVEARGLVVPVARLEPVTCFLEAFLWPLLVQEPGRKVKVASYNATSLPTPYTFYALLALLVGLGVECHSLQILSAVMAAETLRMEAGSCGGDDTAADREGALGAENACLTWDRGRGRTMGGGRAGGGARRWVRGRGGEPVGSSRGNGKGASGGWSGLGSCCWRWCRMG